MELRHAVDLLAGVAGEDAHAETLAVVVGVLAAHADELVPADAKARWITAHVLAEQALVEIVVAGRHRRVYGVERRGAHELKGLVECHASVYVVDQALQVAERGVTLVAMVQLLLDAELLQHQHATHAEQDLLLQAVLPVATVEAVGDGLVKLRVHVVVGVEEIELDTADVDHPHEGVNLVVHVRHVHDHLVAVLVEHALDRQGVEVLGVVFGYLLTIHAQALREVAITIEEADSTHVHVAVGSLFHVVAGEHAEATGVDLQHLVETILHAEVSHGRTAAVGLHVHVLAEIGIDLLHLLHDGLVLDDGLLAVVAEAVEQQHGVVTHLLVELLVETLEKVAGLIIPSPPHVVGQLVKALQLLREARLDVEVLPLRGIRVISFDFHVNLLSVVI